MMNKTELISHHREAELTLLVAKNDTIMEFKGRGISDLYRLYTTMPEALNGAFWWIKSWAKEPLHSWFSAIFRSYTRLL